MSREPGAREKALREMREARVDREIARRKVRKVERSELVERVTEAAKKTGKPRRKK